MRPSAAEALKAAIRRSVPIVLVLAVVGAIAVNVFKQIEGPIHQATARVFHTNTDLASALANIQPAFVDPERSIETALSLARAPEPYARAAQKLEEDPSKVRASTTVSGNQNADVIAFTTNAGNERTAVATANAVADAYVQWRSDIQGSTIRRAIEQLEAQLRRLAMLRLATSGSGSPVNS